MSLFEFIGDQRRTLPITVNEQTCSGKTYIVTGSNTGLGLEAARHLAGAKAGKVILAVRNLEAGEKAKQEIEATTGAHNTVEVWKLDLSSFDSVKTFAKKAVSELPRIDGVIENAGLAPSAFKLMDGHESSVQTNVLATFLLAALLMPKLMATAKTYNVQPRLVFICSEVAFYTSTKADLDKIIAEPLRRLDDEKYFVAGPRYPLSKLLEILAARQFATLLPVKKTDVVINYVNPGLCKTTLSKDASFGTKLMIGTMNFFLGRTPEEGSRNLVHATVAGEDSHGCYMSSCKVEDARVPSWVTDATGQKDQQRLWDDIQKELERVEPGCITKLLK